MYQVELMEDSPKGSFTRVIKGLQSNDVTELFNFINNNSTELFINASDDYIENYYYNAVVNILRDNDNLTDEQKQDLYKIKVYYEAAYNLLEDCKDETANDLFTLTDNNLLELANDKDICLLIMNELDMFNIGINFYKVVE